MKAALTVWDGRLSPVFDVSRQALILVIDDGAVVARHSENIETPTATLKLDRLTEIGVDTVICGAISEPLQHELAARGVKLVAFVAGDIDDVVESFLAGTLPTPALSMPGCRGSQPRGEGVPEAVAATGAAEAKNHRG